MEHQAIALGSILPLRPFPTGGVDEVRSKSRRVLYPTLDRAWRDLPLDLVTAKTDQAIRVVPLLLRKVIRKLGHESRDPSDMPLHLWAEEDGIENPTSCRWSHDGIR